MAIKFPPQVTQIKYTYTKWLKIPPQVTAGEFKQTEGDRSKTVTYIVAEGTGFQVQNLINKWNEERKEEWMNIQMNECSATGWRVYEINEEKKTLQEWINQKKNAWVMVDYIQVWVKRINLQRYYENESKKPFIMNWSSLHLLQAESAWQIQGWSSAEIVTPFILKRSPRQSLHVVFAFSCSSEQDW